MKEDRWPLRRHGRCDNGVAARVYGFTFWGGSVEPEFVPFNTILVVNYLLHSRIMLVVVLILKMPDFYLLRIAC